MMGRKRKGGEPDDLDEELVEKRAKNNNLQEDGIAGTVKRIVLKNFMCHSHLEVKFNENINFIIGRNGSGKSAILTSLIVGLAGKASLTNRGNSIKSFIKAGKNNGSVEITLRNNGVVTYKPDVYGEEITIVRQFASSGVSSYRIKSENGAVVSTQQKEIRQICSYLNIQVDNPVCILNQDTSRNFLNTKDVHQKFALFMKATKLDQLKEDYHTLMRNSKISHRLFDQKKQAFSKLHEQILTLKKKCDNQRTLVDMKQQLHDLQVKLLWAQIRDLKQELAKAQKQEAVLEKEYKDALSNVINVDEQLQSIATRIETIRVQMVEVEREVTEQNTMKNEILTSTTPLSASILKKKREVDVVQNDILRKRSYLKNLQTEIDTLTKNSDQIEEKRQQHMEEVQKVQDKLRNVQDVLETSNNDHFQMRNSLDRMEEDMNSLKMESKQMKIEIDSANSRISSLQKESGNNLSLYGRSMIRIVNAIENNKEQFQQLPRGPLGSYITLKEKQWSKAAEEYLGVHLLKAFVVDNQRDSQTLHKILQQHWTEGGKPMIVTTKFFNRVHDVSANLVQSPQQCASLYEALEISDPIVANTLIDQANIENILLIPNNDMAYNLLSRVQTVPRNCRQGITTTGDRYYPDPNFKFYSSKSRNAQYLQVSINEMIEQLHQQIRNLSHRKAGVEEQYQTIHAEHAIQSVKINELDVKITKLNTAKTHLRLKLDALNNNTEPEMANVESLKKDEKKYQDDIIQRESVIKKIESELASLKEEKASMETRLTSINTAIEGFEDRLAPLRMQISELETQRQEININKNFKQKRVDQFHIRLQCAQKETEEKQQIIQRDTINANVIGKRLKDERSVPELGKEMKSIQSAIRKIESESGDPEKLLNELEEKSQRYEEAETLLEAVRVNTNLLSGVAERRINFYKHIEKYFVTFIKHTFKSAMEIRQFDGSLTIDLKDRKLDMVVKPQQGTQGYTSASNLSGGERSFSTVAFLYSLWQCLQFPFYILDEFDVFMDKANRARVMEILIDHAKRHSNVQYIFLTPQDISFVKDKSVAIHRLDDPNAIRTTQ